MGHDAELTLRIDADATVWVGGQTQTVVIGEVEWPWSGNGESGIGNR